MIPAAAFGAALQHIEMLKDKQEHLLRRQIEAEEQLLYRVSQLHASGQLGETELAVTYRSVARVAAPGLKKRWDASIPVPAARVQYLSRDTETLRRHAPNMPDGTWRGTWPIPDDQTAAVPVAGTCVVYVLYDARNDPCYVGSTQHLKTRLKRHAADGKSFLSWSAFRCDDREAAYQLEEKLLAEHKPYLNKKRYR